MRFTAVVCTQPGKKLCAVLPHTALSPLFPEQSGEATIFLMSNFFLPSAYTRKVPVPDSVILISMGCTYPFMPVVTSPAIICLRKIA